jgi:hypothetical protein
MQIKETYIDIDGEMLLELSLSNLKNNVNRAFGPERNQKAPKTRVTNYQAIPSVQDKTLLLKFKVSGETSPYAVEVRFLNVKYGQEGDGLSSIVAMDGNTYYFKQFTQSQTQAKVKCNCLDFYYRFSVWNHGKNSLEGDPPPPYVRKTDYMPPVNPTKTPGLCKHIMKVMEFLRGENIIR